MYDDLRDYHTMFESIERRVLRGESVTALERIGLTLGVCVSIVGLFLPYVGTTRGWSILVNSSAAQEESPNIIASLAVHASVVFCVLCSAAALYCCALPITVLTATGCAGATCLLSATVSSHMSHTEPSGLSGPGPGLIAATIGAAVLAGLWMRAAAHSQFQFHRKWLRSQNAHHERKM